MLAPHLHLAIRVRIRGAVLLLSLVLSFCGQRQIYLLILYLLWQKEWPSTEGYCRHDKGFTQSRSDPQNSYSARDGRFTPSWDIVNKCTQLGDRDVIYAIRKTAEPKIIITSAPRYLCTYSSRSEGPLAMNIKVSAFWLVTPCSLLDGHERLTSICGKIMVSLPLRRRCHFILKLWHKYTIFHGAVSHKTVISMDKYKMYYLLQSKKQDMYRILGVTTQTTETLLR